MKHKIGFFKTKYIKLHETQKLVDHFLKRIVKMQTHIQMLQEPSQMKLTDVPRGTSVSSLSTSFIEEVGGRRPSAIIRPEETENNTFSTKIVDGIRKQQQKDEELDALYAEAVTLRKNGEYEKSLQLFEQLSQYCGGKMAAYHNQFGILLQHLAMKCAASLPTSTNPNKKQQQQREKDVFLGRAEQQFQKAISIEPMNYIYLANYADLLRVMNRPQYAADYYQKALQLNPSHPITNNNYAYLLHMYLKQHAKACEYYKKCLEFNDHDVIVATNYALCLKELKEYDQALIILSCCCCPIFLICIEHKANIALQQFTDEPMAKQLQQDIINAKIKAMESSQSKSNVNNESNAFENIPNRTHRIENVPELSKESVKQFGMPSKSNGPMIGGPLTSTYPNMNMNTNMNMNMNTNMNTNMNMNMHMRTINGNINGNINGGMNRGRIQRGMENDLVRGTVETNEYMPGFGQPVSMPIGYGKDQMMGGPRGGIYKYMYRY
ncbi:hypothetical protein RFI_11100, partial [Reticulomyxa filosa]